MRVGWRARREVREACRVARRLTSDGIWKDVKKKISFGAVRKVREAKTHGNEESNVHDEDLTNPLDEPTSALDASVALRALLASSKALDESLEQTEDETARRQPLDGGANEGCRGVGKAGLEERGVGGVESLDQGGGEGGSGDGKASRKGILLVVLVGDVGVLFVRSSGVDSRLGELGDVHGLEAVGEGGLGHVDVELARVGEILVVRVDLGDGLGGANGRGLGLTVACWCRL